MAAFDAQVAESAATAEVEATAIEAAAPSPPSAAKKDSQGG